MEKFNATLGESGELMARAFCKALIEYMLGRETTVFDLGVVDTIVKQEKDSQYKVKNMFKGIIAAYFSE